MKVLIIHQHFKIPDHGGAIRSYYLAKGLVSRGIETVVITAHNEPTYKKEQIEGIEVHYAPVAYDNRFGFYKRTKSFLQFVLEAVKYAGWHQNADLCYAISAPLTTGLVGWWIKRKFKIPFMFEVGDLWPDAPIEMGVVRNPILKASLFKLEKLIYQQACSIVALSPAIKSAVESRVPEKTVHLLPNMSDTEFFLMESKRPDLEDKFHVQDKFVIAYIGAIGRANGLDSYLSCALASHQARLPIHFFICGDGALLEEHRTFAQNLGLKNLTFLSFRNRDGVKEILNVTDAVFISYQPIKILETGSPNKYFDGLAAGKLTIINFGGWIRDEIEREQCGVYVNQADPESFTQQVKPFLRDRELLKRQQQAGRMLAVRKYSRTMLSEQFFTILQDSRRTC